MDANEACLEFGPRVYGGGERPGQTCEPGCVRGRVLEGVSPPLLRSEPRRPLPVWLRRMGCARGIARAQLAETGNVKINTKFSFHRGFSQKGKYYVA